LCRFGWKFDRDGVPTMHRWRGCFAASTFGSGPRDVIRLPLRPGLVGRGSVWHLRGPGWVAWVPTVSFWSPLHVFSETVMCPPPRPPQSMNPRPAQSPHTGYVCLVAFTIWEYSCCLHIWQRAERFVKHPEPLVAQGSLKRPRRCWPYGGRLVWFSKCPSGQ
jgi:hypothetical protein